MSAYQEITDINLTINNNGNNNNTKGIRRGFVLNIFSLISWLTVIAAFFAFFTQFISIAYKLFSYSFDGTLIDIPKFLLQGYGILFSIGIIITELDYEISKSISILQNWILRGFLYCFVALLPFDDDSFPSWTMALTLSGSILLGMGVLYSIMGILCLKQIRDQKMARYIQLLATQDIQQYSDASRSWTLDV